MTIKAGDLVMVLRNHCNDEHVGAIFVAGEMSYGPCHCSRCQVSQGFAMVLIPEIERRYPEVGPCGFPPHYLKKIDPLSDLEGQKDSSGLDERHEFYEALRKMAEGLRS